MIWRRIESSSYEPKLQLAKRVEMIVDQLGMVDQGEDDGPLAEVGGRRRGQPDHGA